MIIMMMTTITIMQITIHWKNGVGNAISLFVATQSHMDYMSPVQCVRIYAKISTPPFYVSGPYKTLEWDPHDAMEECWQAFNSLPTICDCWFVHLPLDTTTTETSLRIILLLLHTTPMEEEPWYGTQTMSRLHPMKEWVLQTGKTSNHQKSIHNYCTTTGSQW